MPPEAADPQSWPEAARREMGDDGGTAAAAAHRAAVFGHVDRLHEQLREFNPDVVVVWGDDQYENFTEDIIPAFCVLAYDNVRARPWSHRGGENIWGEDADTEIEVAIDHKFGVELADALLARDIDVAYSYRPAHHPDLPHAFINAVLFMDHRREGFAYPVLPFQINCYGRRVISYQGSVSRLADVRKAVDPRSPSPARCMQMGAAVADAILASDRRVAVVASSSWSHAFLVDKTYRRFPDTAADQELYEAMVAGDWDRWRQTTVDDVEDSGQQELLNWFALAGAMERAGATLDWSAFEETHIFNSSKVVAAFNAVDGE
ncbi:2,3-dihydroxy-p-cumate dioxygenase [Euzebya pacifica]|uniref:2,3-dihydroxy-p-cumate dioxygenase n=2 Tax=Euzebya pacifica TaxID=1608957 RepID=A0A346XWN7_9ACTN|nr:2,3-dihydroxy-p-cumate dioxygenase [Euzebya pacifica]